MENVIILGSGIAGLTAAIYTARANLSPIVFSGPEDGGQLTLTTDVENFPGFEKGIMGPELVAVSKKQAQRFGAKFETDIAQKIVPKNNFYTIEFQSGKVLDTKTIIIATGASARWLGIESEQKFKGRGVSTCATCDGFFYKDKEIIVVGGGDSAMEEAIFLTKFAKKVSIVHRRDDFRASKIMIDKAKSNDKIVFVFNKVVDEIIGDDKGVTGAKLKDTKSNEISEINCDGVFLAIGHIPNTKNFTDILDLDDHGYMKTDRFMHTKHPGVFGAGDVQDTRFRQAITAAGSGCMAAMEAEKYIDSLE